MDNKQKVKKEVILGNMTLEERKIVKQEMGVVVKFSKLCPKGTAWIVSELDTKNDYYLVNVATKFADFV